MFEVIAVVSRLDVLNFRAMGMKTNKLDPVTVAIFSHFPADPRAPL